MQDVRRQLPQTSSAESPYNLLVINSAFLKSALWCSSLLRAVVQVHSCEPLQWLSQALQCVMWSVGLAACVCNDSSEWKPVYCIFIIQFRRFVHISSGRSVLDKMSVQNSNLITLANLPFFPSKELAWFWNCGLTYTISGCSFTLEKFMVHIHSVPALLGNVWHHTNGETNL